MAQLQMLGNMADRPKSASVVGRPPQAGRHFYETMLPRMNDPLEEYERRCNQENDEFTGGAAQGTLRPSGRGVRPKSAVRPQLRASASRAELEAARGWHDMLAEMLADVAQDIIENTGQEIVNAVRVLRCDFASAVQRISDEVKHVPVPAAQVVEEATSSLLHELDRVNKEMHEAIEVETQVMMQCIKEKRTLQDLEMDSLLEALKGTIMETMPITDLQPVLQAIKDNRVEVDLTPVYQAIEDNRTIVDLEPVIRALDQGREYSERTLQAAEEIKANVDSEPILEAVRETRAAADVGPVLKSMEANLISVLCAIQNKRIEIDLSELVGAMREIAGQLCVMRESTSEIDFSNVLESRPDVDIIKGEVGATVRKELEKLNGSE